MSDLLYAFKSTYCTMADPVTPLWKCVLRSISCFSPLFILCFSAHKMSKGFNNSVVLTQNSSGVGHSQLDPFFTY